jgi:hypothetical protein
MTGRLVALVYNAVANLAVELAGEWLDCHVRTIRRTFFDRPGTVCLTDEALLVSLDPFSGQEALAPVVDQFNDQRRHLPRLGNRLLVVRLTPPDRPPEGS